jgi:hypothetical protein
MNKQLKSFITTAATMVSLLVITVTAAASSPKVNTDSLAGVASRQPLVYAPLSAACTKLKLSKDVYWVDLDENGNISDTVDFYPSGTPTITAAFDYDCIPNRTKMSVVWSIDGQQVFTSNDTPQGNAQAGTYTYQLFKKDGSGLDDGDYGVEFYIGKSLLTTGTVTIGDVVTNTTNVTDTTNVTNTNPTTDTVTDVTVQGTVVDSKSKKPISGALLVVLNEGVDATQWLKDGTDADVMAFAKTDGKGQFELNNRIPVGTELPWIVGAKGYQTIVAQKFAIDPAQAADPYVMTISLVRSK